MEVPNSWPTDGEHYAERQQLDDPKKVTEDEGWKTIHCPKEIEFILTLRNSKHFDQAETNNTPFTRPIMKTRFNRSASTRELELVLAGEYEEEDLDQLSRLF